MTRTLTPAGVHRVVVACEDSSAAPELFSVAREMASRLGADLTPVRVRAVAASGPRRTATLPAPAEAGVSLVEGIPAIEIVRFAESRKAELLILGAVPKGVGTLKGLKALADAVVRRAEMPCLVLPAGQTRFGRMVVALDGSERGMWALRTAWSLRSLATNNVLAIFIEPGGNGAEGIIGPGGTAGQRIQAGVFETVGPGVSIQVVHRQGDIVEQVLEEISHAPGDLLVVGVRRGGPAAVAESTGNGRRLLAAASCAVLTVPL
ncbi:MAG: universal stress protein [Gemmatimonadota bacterium]|nr:universal stress protein [Gemmatimonadota bacterium]